MRVGKHTVQLICFVLMTVAQPLSSQGGIGIFQFSTSAIIVSEDSGTLDIVIENTGDTSVAAALRISTRDITATIYEDFVPSSQFVQFSSGDRTQQYSLGIINDALSEGNEMFALDLTLLGPTRPSARIGENSELTVTLIDDEQPSITTSTPVSVSSQQNSGGNITLNTEAEIEVVCNSQYIEVTLKRADYPGLLLSNGSYPHLDDENCVPGFTDETLVRFTFGLEQCNTERTGDDENIVYKNNVYLQLNQETNDSAITREHQQQIPFQCSFHKKATISKVSYSPRVTIVLTDAENYGNFTYFMDMYENENNTEIVETFPKEVGLGQPMYFGFRVESGDSKLQVFPDVCKATLSSDYDATPDHLIIENACSRDNTLQYNYEPSATHHFNVAAFRFKDGYDDVFIHCKLTVCRDSDQESRCAKGCEGGSRRRRRSLEEDMSANLYIGPVHFSNRRQRETDQENSDPREVAADSNSMVVIVAVLVGVLAVVALGLIVALVIVTKRHRYQSAEKLIVTDM